LLKSCASYLFVLPEIIDNSQTLHYRVCYVNLSIFYFFFFLLFWLLSYRIYVVIIYLYNLAYDKGLVSYNIWQIKTRQKKKQIFPCP
jgi:hypothetical protein